jgi:hypothetical protein
MRFLLLLYNKVWVSRFFVVLLYRNMARNGFAVK